MPGPPLPPPAMGYTKFSGDFNNDGMRDALYLSNPGGMPGPRPMPMPQPMPMPMPHPSHGGTRMVPITAEADLDNNGTIDAREFGIQAATNSVPARVPLTQPMSRMSH